MPRPGLPTPVSSTDIMAKEKANPSSLEMSFSLPPPAMNAGASDRSESASTTNSSSGSSYHPASPISPETTAQDLLSRTPRRSSTSKRAREDFTLPPPPTRSRKIIQMKPKAQDSQTTEGVQEKPKGTPKSAASATVSGNKRKQPSSTSVAGRKIARKTAHSLIERRRRSKMNEEFGTLKDMIPACKDQEMHKLAILQASIDYLRYLEQCVTDLKAANNGTNNKTPTQPPPNALRASPTSDSDLSMTNTGAQHSPTAPAPQALRYHHQASPTFSPLTQPRHYSYSSFTPTLPSPAFEPSYHLSQQLSHMPCPPYAAGSSASSASPSPALLPQQYQRGTSTTAGGDVDVDHEATAALLMLNADRRGTGLAPVSVPAADRRGKGMSVKDLLSA